MKEKKKDFYVQLFFIRRSSRYFNLKASGPRQAATIAKSRYIADGGCIKPLGAIVTWTVSGEDITNAYRLKRDGFAPADIEEFTEYAG